MGALEPPHLILILVIVLIIFGPGKLPQLGKALGDGMRELKRATNEDSAAKSATPEQFEAALVAPAAQSTWTCGQCHAVAPVTDRFCGTCGATREAAGRTAPLSSVL